ncbi:MAG TPA: hypothetical protein DCQ31_08905 [Bacteroidales bacterium]|nr:hypothetical protein [Bacteroidales bacterium]
MGSLTCNINIENNNLNLRFEGFFTDDEVAETLSEVQSAIDQLKPGFVIINDVRDFKPAGSRGLDHLRNAMKYAGNHGAKRVVRIVNKLSLGSGQFSRVGAEAAPYEQITVSSPEDAEEFLQ